MDFAQVTSNSNLIKKEKEQKDNKTKNISKKELENQLNEEKEKNENFNNIIYELRMELNIQKDEVGKLKKLLEQKDKEINELKSNNNNIINNTNNLYNLKPDDEIISINFNSENDDIKYYSLPCKKSDIFSHLEEKLYNDYPQYKDKETFFVVNGQKIKKFKTLKENNVKSNDLITVYEYK